MKNLLLTLLITLSTTILAKTPDSLFGISLNDNILNYATKEELKSKGKGPFGDYFFIRLKNPPINNQSYIDKIYVFFDLYNKISSIQSEKDFQKLETCKVKELPVRNLLMDKFNIKFNPYTNINYGFYSNEGGAHLATECMVTSDNEITLLIYLESKEYSDNRREYLNSQI